MRSGFGDDHVSAPGNVSISLYGIRFGSGAGCVLRVALRACASRPADVFRSGIGSATSSYDIGALIVSGSGHAHSLVSRFGDPGSGYAYRLVPRFVCGCGFVSATSTCDIGALSVPGSGYAYSLVSRIGDPGSGYAYRMVPRFVIGSYGICILRAWCSRVPPASPATPEDTASAGRACHAIAPSPCHPPTRRLGSSRLSCRA